MIQQLLARKLTLKNRDLASVGFRSDLEFLNWEKFTVAIKCIAFVLKRLGYYVEHGFRPRLHDYHSQIHYTRLKRHCDMLPLSGNSISQRHAGHV